MSIYPPPTEILPIFNTSDYITTTTTPNYAVLDGILTNYPISQRSGAGNATGQDITILGNYTAGTYRTNTLLAAAPEDNISLYDNVTTSANSFNMCVNQGLFAITALGNKTSANSSVEVGNFTISTNATSDAILNVIGNSTDMNLGTGQTTGNFGLGGNANRTGAINIGSLGSFSPTKEINIGASGKTINFGSLNATLSNKIYIGGKSRYAWSQTIALDNQTFEIPYNFPTEGQIIITGTSNVITFSAFGTFNRLFTIQNYGNGNIFDLNPDYTYGGLLTGYAGTPTALPAALELLPYSNYYFLIDEENSLCILISATNFLNKALTYPATLPAAYSTNNKRGNRVYTFTITGNRGIGGIVSTGTSQTITLTRYGVYCIQISCKCFMTITSGNPSLQTLGFGVRTDPASTTTFTNSLEGLGYYNNCLNEPFISSAKNFTKILTGYYTYSELSFSSSLYIESTATYNNTGGTVSMTSDFNINLVG